MSEENNKNVEGTEVDTATSLDSVNGDKINNEDVANDAEVMVPESSVATETIDTDTVSEENLTKTATSKTVTIKPYLVAAGVVIIMGLVLLFALEQQGRVQTGLFGNIDSLLAGPAATVNGVAVSRDDFDRNFEQVLREVEMQGFAGQLDPAMEASLREQAVQSLINAELLKQAAEAAGATVSTEEIEARLAEIEAGNGGAEELAARMLEFGITMEQLQIDIEREILIQNHLNSVLNLEAITITDEELEETYNQILVANEGTEIPPLSEVSAMLADQLLNDKQQQVVGEYIDTLRAEADIVINV